MNPTPPPADPRAAPTRIILVRHGRSAHTHDRRWMRAVDVGRFEDDYDAAGILDDDAPPSELVEMVARADAIVASDLPRAIASARRVAPQREPELVPLLREIRLEPPLWIPVPLPIELWDALSHAQWTYRLRRGTDHQFVRRGREAADWLVRRAATAPTIVVITHGGFRRIVASCLANRGWRADGSSRSYQNWSAWGMLGDGVRAVGRVGDRG
jgi:broad specificity phosphatase PhoE